MKHDLPGQLELPVGDTPNPSVLRGVVGLVTPAELAAALGIAEQTLSAWRCLGQGPDFVKLGKSVFYRMADIQAWVHRNVTKAVAAVVVVVAAGGDNKQEPGDTSSGEA